MHQLKEELQKAVRKMDDFEKLQKQIEMTITSEGLRVELLESESGVFFLSGRSDPSPGGREVLVRLAAELGKLPNKISIEGHTDARPFAPAAAYGNWELSADRANAARRLMQQSGLGSAQVVQVRGFADQRLRKPDAPEDASNRRISLIVLYQEKAADELPAAANGHPPATKH